MEQTMYFKLKDPNFSVKENTFDSFKETIKKNPFAFFKKINWDIIFFLSPFLVVGIIVTSGGVKDSISFLFVLTVFVGFGIYVHFYRKYNSLFWEKLAEVNGWNYSKTFDCSKEKWLMITQGYYSRDHEDGPVKNYITGLYGKREFRIFEFDFEQGGKGVNEKKVTKKTEQYSYTVFGFKYEGEFPHIYLNSRQNDYGFSFGKEIVLSDQFSKKFQLFIPEDYEIEAYQIFTHDIMLHLLQIEFEDDIEFVNKEMLIFVKQEMNIFENFEKKFNQILEISNVVGNTLDTIKYVKIGDKSDLLT